MSDAQKWLSAANKRLKGVPISLEMSGKANNIYLRGIFPAQPWETNQTTRQRKISIGIRAIEEKDVKNAESMAREVSLDLNRNNFNWTDLPGVFDPRTPDPTTIGDWATQLEKEKRDTMAPYTWRYNYELIMVSLPMEQELSEVTLIDWILTENPTADTMRAKYVTIAAALCEVAGIPANKVRKLRKDMPNKNVNPRDLPDDSAIVAMWDFNKENSWAWAYGMLATYGLRPHELFRLDLSIFPEVRVLENSKTGERIVPAIHPHWLERFDLTSKIRLPQQLRWSPDQPNWILGRKIGMGFTRHKLGDPYNLRHCYARRCLELGLTSDVSSKLMGHSREIHERKYRAFIKSSVYVDAAKRMISKHSP